MNSSNESNSSSVIKLMFGDGTPKKAFLTALVVGTMLTVINHGDSLLKGDYPPFIKVVLTYCVPYCVTTWGACTGKLAQLKKQKKQSVLQTNTKA